VVISEYGPDLSRFRPRRIYFPPDAGAAPAHQRGKPVKKKRRNTASTRVAAALRMAALSLRHSPTALGAYYRGIARRIGGDVAVFATARKLGTLITVCCDGDNTISTRAQRRSKPAPSYPDHNIESQGQGLGFELVQTLQSTLSPDPARSLPQSGSQGVTG